MMMSKTPDEQDLKNAAKYMTVTHLAKLAGRRREILERARTGVSRVPWT